MKLFLGQPYMLNLNTTFMTDKNSSSPHIPSTMQDPIGVRLSRNISYRRKELGLTQAQLAEKMGIEPETLSRFERGKHLPSLATLEKLADLLLIPVADLLAEQPKTADEDALVITSWLAGLNSNDRAFLYSILKQSCDYLTTTPIENRGNKARVE